MMSRPKTLAEAVDGLTWPEGYAPEELSQLTPDNPSKFAHALYPIIRPFGPEACRLIKHAVHQQFDWGGWINSPPEDINERISDPTTAAEYHRQLLAARETLESASSTMEVFVRGIIDRLLQLIPDTAHPELSDTISTVGSAVAKIALDPSNPEVVVGRKVSFHCDLSDKIRTFDVIKRIGGNVIASVYLIRNEKNEQRVLRTINPDRTDKNLIAQAAAYLKSKFPNGMPIKFHSSRNIPEDMLQELEKLSRKPNKFQIILRILNEYWVKEQLRKELDQLDARPDIVPKTYAYASEHGFLVEAYAGDAEKRNLSTFEDDICANIDFATLVNLIRENTALAIAARNCGICLLDCTQLDRVITTKGLVVIDWNAIGSTYIDVQANQFNVNQANRNSARALAYYLYSTLILCNHWATTHETTDPEAAKKAKQLVDDLYQIFSLELPNGRTLSSYRQQAKNTTITAVTENWTSYADDQIASAFRLAYRFPE